METIVELRALTDYRNVDFSIPKGSTTIDKLHISEKNKAYLIETFPEWFEETTQEKEDELEAHRLYLEQVLAANQEGVEAPNNPFEVDAVTTKTSTKDVEDIVNQESKAPITNQESKVKSKKK